ncbi:MAG: AMP-binding protein [Planctomycetes bacterium]|nr:AMP-binding protein [Planctomycetota bacterium]
MRRLGDWRALERAPTQELKAMQEARLARFVREELYPFSPHYRRVFDEARVAPDSIRTVADLRRLPFTTKQDLLNAQVDPEHRLDFVLQPSPEKIRASWPLSKKLGLLLGGAAKREELRFAYTPNFVTFTTGRSSDPVAFTYTPHDLAVLGEAIARMFDVARVNALDERLINLMPFAPHLAFWAVTLGGFTAGRMVLPTGGGKVMGTDGNLRMMERAKPTVLVGVPGFVYHLVRQAREEKRDLSRVHTVVLGAEKVPPGLKTKIAECLAACGAKKVHILGTYGFTESRLAFIECPTAFDVSSGYHLQPDLSVFEVIDPKTGEVVPDNADGELVYTGISGHGTCVLRYRTGDLAVGGQTWAPCPHCGRTLPRIASELKRVSEQHALSLTKIKGTLVDLSQMGFVLSSMAEIEEWQVVISKKGDDPLELDELEVRVAPRNGLDADALREKVKKELIAATEVAPTRVQVLSLDELVRTLGMETELKEKRFLDRRPK